MNTDLMIINGKEINRFEVQSLLSADQKMLAIKYIMDHASIGLGDAKEIVDEMNNSAEPTNLDNEVLNQIKDLLRRNQKVEAVKLTKSATGLGLKESKDLVENLDGLSSAELLATFGGRTVNNPSLKMDNSAINGDHRNVASSKAEYNFPDPTVKKSTLFVNDSPGKIKKALLLIIVGIAALIYYFYQRQ